MDALNAQVLNLLGLMMRRANPVRKLKGTQRSSSLGTLKTPLFLNADVIVLECFLSHIRDADKDIRFIEIYGAVRSCIDGLRMVVFVWLDDAHVERAAGCEGYGGEG